MNSQTANKISRGDLFDIAMTLGLFGALVYFAGWTFIYEYYYRFQLGLLGVEIPLEYFFIYGYWVFLDWQQTLFFILALIFLAYLLSLVNVPRFSLPVSAKRCLSVILGFLLFVGVASMASQTAARFYSEQYNHNFPAYPRARVWLKSAEDKDELLQILKTKLSQGCHRLFLQNKDKLFLFLPSGKPDLALVEVPMAEVRALRMFAPTTEPNCET